MIMLAPFSAHFLKNPSPKPEDPPVITIVFPATQDASYGSEVSMGRDCRIASTRDPRWELLDIARVGKVFEFTDVLWSVQSLPADVNKGATVRMT